jgi:hypothetical protein
MNVTEIVLQLRDERSRLDAAIQALDGVGGGSAPIKRHGHPPRTTNKPTAGIGGRPLAFLETAALFLGAGLPFCFAHQAFFAAPILACAAELVRRRSVHSLA